MRVGVLALQGAHRPHVATLERLGHRCSLVRAPADLRDIEGLVLPGGESTTMLTLLRARGLLDMLREPPLIPVLATCAGLILVAAVVTGPRQTSLGWLDVEVARNGYGSQLDSAVVESDPPDPRRLVLIRAPRITRVGPEVSVELRHRGEPMLVRQGRCYGATFHPELTADSWLHRRVFGALDGARAADHGDATPDALPALPSPAAPRLPVLSPRR
ncbi:MAG: pyridoxal 5'-phosphate synthase glutaminase subunit PdxT [Myxococcales bacterium]|nr:pyridoxal 5'-phosphate synthase glutaminase subunit PdxT [Myxococcales bacterium]